MPRKILLLTQPNVLTAEIEKVEQTYYISEYAAHARPVGGEAAIEIVGRIVQIGSAFKQHQHETIEISLLCERSFERDGRTPPSDRPFLLPIQLRKNRRSLMAYLPADAFWALPHMIGSGAITHVEARFASIFRGSADLLSIYFAPASKLTTDDWVTS